MRAIITVLGTDTTGIIAGVSDVLLKQEVNILDISQQVMEGVFSMVMLVDISKSKDIDTVRKALDEKSQVLKVKTHIMHEDVFHSMHRI